MITRLLPAALIAALVPIACSTPPGQVSASELAELRRTSSDVQPGLAKQQVLARFRAGERTRLGSSLVGSVTIEEWEVHAFTDPDKAGAQEFRTFLYFVDDVLVDVTLSKLSYRDSREILDEWRSRGRVGDETIKGAKEASHR